MPELPEVETIRSYLCHGVGTRPGVLGTSVLSVELFWPRSIAYPSGDEFKERLVGQKILEIDRRGKYLIFILSEYKLLVHLRMSGDLFVRSSSEPPAPHDRILFHLDTGNTIVFNDTRKFGRAWLVREADEVTQNLGPEPFDSSLKDVFHNRLGEKHRQIKPLLLDQSFLAGLGNIYTDEALFLAGIHPKTLSDRLTREQSQKLLESIRQVLQEGIQSHGASIDWVYRGGDFQNHFRVYQRTGLSCPVCGTQIERLIIGQRGTHYCPSCQKGN
jgi:formamidopyrimidine-DNA glycosylase